MQLLIPAMFFTFYFIKKNKPGFQIALFWFGESMMNVSVYASDARTHALPLLGGNKTYHDWTWMLSRLDLMAYDTLIGDIFYYSGIVCFIIVFFAPLIIKPENKSARTADIDLNL